MIYNAKLHITHLLLEGKNNLQSLLIRTLNLLYNYVMTKYDIHET